MSLVLIMRMWLLSNDMESEASYESAVEHPWLNRVNSLSTHRVLTIQNPLVIIISPLRWHKKVAWGLVGVTYPQVFSILGQSHIHGFIITSADFNELKLKATSMTGWWFGTFVYICYFPIYFPYILGKIIIPTDELHFSEG